MGLYIINFCVWSVCMGKRSLKKLNLLNFLGRDLYLSHLKRGMRVGRTWQGLAETCGLSWVSPGLRTGSNYHNASRLRKNEILLITA